MVQVALKLMRWDDLERRVCGIPAVDIELLRSATEYEGYSESDNVVKWFWEILTEYSLEERKAYLQFVWGRTRLPLTRDQFSKRMKITKLSKCVFRPFRVADFSVQVSIRICPSAHVSI